MNVKRVISLFLVIGYLLANPLTVLANDNITNGIYFNKFISPYNEKNDNASEKYIDIVKSNNDEYLATSSISNQTFSLTKFDSNFNIIEKQVFDKTADIKISKIHNGFLVGRFSYIEENGWCFFIEEYDINFNLIKSETIYNKDEDEKLEYSNVTDKTKIYKLDKNYRYDFYYVSGYFNENIFPEGRQYNADVEKRTVMATNTEDYYAYWRSSTKYIFSLFNENLDDSTIYQSYDNELQKIIEEEDYSYSAYYDKTIYTNKIMDDEEIRKVLHRKDVGLIFYFKKASDNKYVLVNSTNDPKVIDSNYNDWHFEYESGYEIKDVELLEKSILVIGSDPSNNSFIQLIGFDGKPIYKKEIDNCNFINIINVNERELNILANSENGESLIVNFSIYDEYLNLNCYGNLNLSTNLDSSIKVSLSTDRIIFSNFNGVSDISRNFALNIESSLNYDVYVKLNSMPKDFNTNLELNNSLLSLSLIGSNEVVEFNEVGRFYKLIENAQGESTNVHDIEFKLKANRPNAGTFNSSLGFQIIQK